MYAIVNINGNQTRVEPNAIVTVPRVKGEPGARLTFDQVMLVSNGDSITVGKPYLKGASVAFEVVDHPRGEKIYVMKFKRRRDFSRRTGHRSELTRLKVSAIQA
ncbi:MAG: 50S ribosomal protein L21 [Candidatus Eisenbacteria bacterium]|uniref:Large ribosomal subunit protein bL21 n=1 Tax=Eiseniibacteriota bacterium TaxID=2212470 RepID=A0A849SB40_UNCEI|nr:50S ribosomal protein L21 [Candidatus Eisenbacteria bacterium]